MEQLSTEMDDAETCEIWTEKLFDNFKIIADVMKVKFEQKCSLVNSKQERIFELENVLKTSVKIASERETEFHQLVQVKEDMDVKVHKLEQRILSLQSAKFLRCSKCQRYQSQFEIIVNKLENYLLDRRNDWNELNETKREIMESLLSEKDSQIALLEVFGAKSQQQVERLDILRSDRSRLNQRLKVESEKSINVLLKYDVAEEELLRLLKLKEPILDDHD